jgi:AbrB family looped-hinge helix DNA binding protein
MTLSEKAKVHAMPEIRMTTKGRITVPKAFREEWSLQAGDKLQWTIQDDGSVTVEPAKKRKSKSQSD